MVVNEWLEYKLHGIYFGFADTELQYDIGLSLPAKAPSPTLK